MSYQILLDLAIILLSAKLLGLLMRRLGLPQVVGALLAGILIGPAIWGDLAPVANSAPLTVIAEIGVLLIMFSAGLEMNFAELKKNAKPSLVIMIVGVVVPLGMGYTVVGAFYGFNADKALLCLLMGAILAATSTGIVVETLKEMGKLNGKIGSSIMCATVLEDILSIIILCVILSVNDANVSGGSVTKPILITIGKIAGFFAGAMFLGFFLHKFAKFLSKKYPEHRRLPIFGICTCFLFAWAAEKIGIADVTGAFIAGVIFSNIESSEYIEKRIDTGAYLLFAPVFFAHIGLGVSFAGLTWPIFGFAVCLLLVAVVSKIIGCGGGALLCKYGKSDSLRVGVGMIGRGEFSLIIAMKGVAAGLLLGEHLTVTVFVVIVTLVLTPILLKLTYRKSPPDAPPHGQEQPGAEPPETPQNTENLKLKT